MGGAHRRHCRRITRLAGDAHRSSLEKNGSRAGHGVFRDTAVSRRFCLDPARRPQRRRSQQAISRRDGRRRVSLQYFYDDRADLCHGALQLPIRFFHDRQRMRADLLGFGGRSGYLRGEQAQDRMDDYLTPGLAGVAERIYHRFSPFAFALWRAGDPWAAGRNSYDYDPDLDFVSVPAAPGASRGLFRAAPARHHGADRIAKENSRPARF